VTVRTPSELKGQMPVSQTPNPGKVYAAHLHDIVDTMESLTASPVLTLTGSHTATLAQSGMRFVSTGASAITLTVPSNAPVGYDGLILQVGAGTVSVLPGPVLSRESHTKTAGAGSQAYFWVYENPGSAPKVALSGDTSP
jgi:hypothetical protein